LRPTRWLCAGPVTLIFLFLLTGVSGQAEDITTKSGKTYENVTNIVTVGNGISFSYTLPHGTYRTTVPVSDLPDDVKEKYYDPFEAGLALARQNRLMKLSLNSAFRLSNLEAAREKAVREHKPLGFIMVWDNMFGYNSRPMGWGSNDQLAHFFTVFNNSLVLVFVRHEDELNQVPDSVKQGFFSPAEGGHAPNMAVVSGDASKFICEIPLGLSADGQSFGTNREVTFRADIPVIKKFLADQKTTPAAPK
jgi:hypothetical protein